MNKNKKIKKETIDCLWAGLVLGLMIFGIVEYLMFSMICGIILLYASAFVLTLELGYRLHDIIAKIIN